MLPVREVGVAGADAGRAPEVVDRDGGVPDLREAQRQLLVEPEESAHVGQDDHAAGRRCFLGQGGEGCEARAVSRLQDLAAMGHGGAGDRPGPAARSRTVRTCQLLLESCEFTPEARREGSRMPRPRHSADDDDEPRVPIGESAADEGEEDLPSGLPPGAQAARCNGRRGARVAGDGLERQAATRPGARRPKLPVWTMIPTTTIAPPISVAVLGCSV